MTYWVEIPLWIQPGPDAGATIVSVRLPADTEAATRARIEQVYDTLPQTVQLVLLLFCYDRLPPAAIARLLRCSRAGVEACITRARERIAREAEQTGLSGKEAADPDRIGATLADMIEKLKIPTEQIERMRALLADYRAGGEENL